ncbi:heavy metal-associated domain-containing protein [Microbacterium sp.]|uniref:heavy-metal-associated domain-containing protein n=1 Tax=Microbacterium sp. TaxID=51671 RepID=UPI002630C1A4|nr:heavy metal-associated domain-containing protein [Microbacterium sp.]
MAGKAGEWVVTELRFWVNGMTCAHCERAVTAELVSLDGVRDVRVDAATGSVVIQHDAPLIRAAVQAAVEDAGYELRSWPADSDE